MWSQQLWSSCSRYSGLPRRSFYTCSSPPAASKMPLCFDRMLRAAHGLAASWSSLVNISHYTFFILLHHVRVSTVCLRMLLTHLTSLKDLFQSAELCSCSSLCLQLFALLALSVGYKLFFFLLITTLLLLLFSSILPVSTSLSCHLQLGEGLPAVHSFSENKEVTCLFISSAHLNPFAAVSQSNILPAVLLFKPHVLRTCMNYFFLMYYM